MARTLITLTSAWQEAATGRAVFMVESSASGAQIALNDTASDTAALRRLAEPGGQFSQTSSVSTFAKGAGIVLIVDEE